MKRLFQPTILLLLVTFLFALSSLSMRANTMVQSVSTLSIFYHNNQLDHGGPLSAIKKFVDGLMLSISRVEGTTPAFFSRLSRVKQAYKGVQGLNAQTSKDEVKFALNEFKSALSQFKKVIPNNDPNKESIYSGFNVFLGFIRMF